MNYDNSQQYSFNFGLAAAAPVNQQSATQNVSGTIYPYTLQGAGELQQQQLQAKVATAPAGPAMATVAGKNILYDPQQHQLQQQQFQQHQLHPQTATFNMVQGGTLVGRQGMFPVAAGLQMPQDPLCSPQAMVDVYGGLSPNMVAQKVTSTAAMSGAGYKNLSNWMSIPQAISNMGNNTGNSNTVVSTNNQTVLPSFGHLWSHFQQQQQQKQQTAVTTFIQPSPQHQQPQPQQHQPGIANFQSVQVFQSSPAGLQVSPGGLQVSPGGLQVSPGGLQVSPGGLQVSPGGLHMSPGSMQMSPGGQTFHVPQSLQGTLSPNPLASAGVSFSGLRQVHMSGTVGSGIRNQVVVAPRGQVIMAQTFSTTAAAFGFNNDVKNFHAVPRLASAGPCTSSPATHHFVTTATTPSPSTATTVSVVTKPEASKEISTPFCSQVALTTTTVTVTTSACNLNATTATTVHVSVPLTTTISVLPSVNSSSCEHIQPATPLSCLASAEESGRGSVSPSTPSTAASMSTQESISGDSGKHELHLVKVPYSWRRVVENGVVHYFSPSDVCLSSFEEIRMYLSQSNTCKCGLECPLIVERTFNFDPALEAKPWSMEDVTCSQDLTKLCNHKRKVLALAAFQSSTAGQDSHSKSDGPSAKCRKKGKQDNNLVVSPLVVDSKLKTSITNAVNKHAAASAQNLNSSNGNYSNTQASEVMGGGNTVPVTSAGQTVDNTLHVHAASQMSSAPPNCVVDRSGSIHYPSPSPMSHSPASIHSTPGVPLAGDHMEGMSPMSGQFPSKLELGRNHTNVAPGMRFGAGAVGPNHVDPRAFQQSAVQCNIFSQEEMKQPYFMQQLQQHQQPHHHPPNQFNACGMPMMATSHQGPPFGAQTFRAVNPLGMQSQYPAGFPHGQHQQQQSSQQLYPQHNYSMVYQMNMPPQQQQHVHPQHQPHPPQSLHHHHQPPAHPMFQNVRMGSQWPPQHPPAHHSGPAPPPGYHSDTHQLHGSGVFTGMYPQAGDLMWLETGKPKSKRPRSKKDKQKLNSIVDRTSPCDADKLKVVPTTAATSPVVSKCIIPSTTASTMPSVFSATTNKTTLPCSVSFLENPAIFVAQQTAIINNSLASCHIDLNSPTNPPSNSLYPKVACDSVCTIPTSVPTVKVEQDCEERTSDTSLPLKAHENIDCKKEPGNETPVQHTETEMSVNATNTPDAQKSSSPCVSVNCNNNQLVLVSKSEPPSSLNTAVSLGVDCTCGTGSENISVMHSRKKVSPKPKSRTKSILTTKASNTTPSCLPDFVPSAVHQQQGVQQHLQQQPSLQQQHPQPLGETGVSTVPFQIPDLSQLLAAGGTNNNLNLLSLQQAMAQYASPGAGNSSGLNVGSGNADGGGLMEFPASSLLTAAARAQLSQQTSLGSFLLPAFFPAGGVAGPDVTAAVQQQQQQQPEESCAAAQNNAGGTDAGVKAAGTVLATGLLGVNPASVAPINQTGQLPLQLVQGVSIAPAGVVPTGPFHAGGLIAQGVQGVQTVQGLPLNVVLPVNQPLVGLGADPMQGFSVDASGNVVASVSLGTAACKSVHVSPKVVTTVVDSVAAVSPGANVTVFSSMGSVPSGFPPQGCESIKGAGSTVHHLPQNSAVHSLSIGQNIGQNISLTASQSTPPNLGQTLSQNAAPSVGQNMCPGLSASVNPNVAQNIGVSPSLGLGTGETVMLNGLLPPVLTFNTPMPPISLPMVTNVTNSLTQVIPAAGTTPALLAQQQQQQQQQATAQFLNALALPAVAAAALNPLFVAHPNPVQAAATSPGAQFPSKPVEGVTEAKDCPSDPLENKLLESEQPDESEESTNQKPEDTTEPSSGETVRMVDVTQGSQPQILSMASGDHTQQQVIVLPGGGLPLMQVLSNGPHTLGTTPGMVDKLCNTTQVFLPSAPPAATLPDLAQLGTVAALTPLGIQQMWNSLNSLQLQQLQTLQLQQLVWQQLQGMQALPLHLQTVDGCAAGSGQSLPMQFFTGVQQLHNQQTQQTSGQQQVQAAVTHINAGDLEGGDTQDDNLFSGSDNPNTSSVDADDGGGSKSAIVHDNLNGDSRKARSVMAEDKTDNSKPGHKTGSASNNQVSTAKSLQKTGMAATAHNDPKCSYPNHHSQDSRIVSAGSVGGSQNKKSFPSLSGEGREARGAAGDTEANHVRQNVAVNGDCVGTEHRVGGTVNRRRGVKRSLDDRCIAADSSKALSGPGSVGLIGVPVMSGPAPKLVGQGPCTL